MIKIKHAIMAVVLGLVIALGLGTTTPAQAIVQPDVYNGDPGYAVTTFQANGASKLILPRTGSGSLDIRRIAVGYNTYISYTINGLGRTVRGDVVPVIYMGAYDRVVIQDIWLR